MNIILFKKYPFTNIILIVFLSYPLIFSIPSDNIFLISIFYFTIILSLISIVIFLYIVKIKITLTNLLQGIILLLVLLNFNTLRYTMPLLFFVYCFVLYIFFKNFKAVISLQIIYIFFIIYILFSIFFLIDESRYANMGRYAGFSSSSTTYTIYLIAIAILIFFFEKQNWKKIIIFFILLFFINLSQTRLNLVFFIFSPLLIYILKIFPWSKLIIYVSFIIGLNILYPIYDLAIQDNKSIIAYRYTEGRDSSFELRYVLFKITLKEFQRGNLQEKLLGRGAEFSRLLILDNFQEDIFPHNDFIRFLTDFGIITTFLFLLFLYKIGTKSDISFLLLLLYLLSFYHNMIYNMFLISLMLYFSTQINTLKFNDKVTPGSLI